MTQMNSHDQHYTLGVAGHIDHGKTTLTKALTGKETDRLKEEQTRKISIELGFASFELSNGERVGVVDVPGHERFIRQMVAGVAGIDMVLLVIAADEGVMPQTKEHLDILHLLGVEKGVIVLTKVDTVDHEFLELVHESVREETEHTFLHDSPILEVDSLSGQGIEQLKQQIEGYMSTVPARSIHGIARLPVDRVFSKKGFGTIITGTMYQGKIEVGDELELLPEKRKVKVRHIQVHDQSKQTAYAGQRVALNISDVSVEEIKRGDVLATVKTIEPTTRIDVQFHMLADLDFSLKQRSDIRLHLGTSDVLGRIIFFDRNECQPGEQCFAQLELNEPVSTLFEDRYVLRRPTPMTTIGGGMVIDPYAQKHRFGEDTIGQMKLKMEGDIAQRSIHLIEQKGLMTLDELAHQLGVSAQDWLKEIHDPAEKGLKLIEEETRKQPLIISIQLWKRIWDQIVSELRAYHKRYPLREGMERVQIQKKYFETLSTAQWNLVLKTAELEGLVRLRKELVSAFDFEAQLREKDEQIWKDIQKQMNEQQMEVLEWEDLFRQQVPDEVKHDLQRLLLRKDQLVPLTDTRLLERSIFERLVQQLKEQTPSTFSIKDVRQVFDTSRKYLIPFLEALDEQGYTFRHENDRKWKI